MKSSSKRQKTSPSLDNQDDFVSFAGNDLENVFDNASIEPEDQYQPFKTPNNPGTGRGGILRPGNWRESYDSRNAQDKPKSTHTLTGHEPWVLVRTMFHRRFVHNMKTKESLWRIPKDIMPGVIEFEKWEKEQREKAENAEWAEGQLKQMREQSKADEVNRAAEQEVSSRRRRSESLQREDEEAVRIALAAQTEHAEEQDAKEAPEAVRNVHQRAQEAGMESDSEYELVEVTDSEYDDGENDSGTSVMISWPQTAQLEQAQEEEPVEFGEDDIAYQLAAMGEDHALDPGEYGEDIDERWEESEEGLPVEDEAAADLFRDLLDDYHISPFTLWDRIIADDSEASMLNDDRYTVLPNMRVRKEIFDMWARDKAAQLKKERAATEQRDPKIAYLALLQDKATTKLFWPEFKRKFKKEPAMTDRKLDDKDREKLYRDHVSRLKLPESSREADLRSLIKAVPLKAMSRSTTLDSLPQQVLSHLHFISLAPSARDAIITAYIKTLPETPDADDQTGK